jgi:hypothetical protein
MKLLLGILAVSLALGILTGFALSEPLRIQATAVDLHVEDSKVLGVGRLTFQGGLSLTSSNARLGGVSGLAVSPDGRRLTAVTDGGDWVRLAPTLSPDGRLTGIAHASFGRLYGRNGKPLRRRRDRDAESLIAIDNGFIVSFEHHHRIRIYRGGPNPFLSRPTVIRMPALSSPLPANAGLEALARLRDGRLVAFAEGHQNEALIARGWIHDNKRWNPFRYKRQGHYLPTGATTLPDGDLLVLERRFSLLGGFGTRLLILPAKSIVADGTASGQEIVRLERPLITENFEGVAAHRSPAGDTVLYIISDDNFLPLQRTILLKFTLDG